MHTKKQKQYRKNEWRKVLNMWGDILYQWRPVGKGYIEIKN